MCVVVRTGRQRRVCWIISISHFPQKSSLVDYSFAKRDLRRKAVCQKYVCTRLSHMYGSGVREARGLCDTLNIRETARYVRQNALDISRRVLYNLKGALCICKTAPHIHKKALYIHKTALQIRLTTKSKVKSKKLYRLSKEPYILQRTRIEAFGVNPQSFSKLSAMSSASCPRMDQSPMRRRRTAKVKWRELETLFHCNFNIDLRYFWIRWNGVSISPAYTQDTHPPDPINHVCSLTGK